MQGPRGYFVLVPPAPTATAATLVGATSFTANWNMSAGATGYYLDIATNASFTAMLSGYNNLSVRKHVDQSVQGLTAGTPYYYRVRATNATGGASGNSNIIGVTTTPPSPVATGATNVSQTSFTANWNASTGAAGYYLDVATDVNFTAMLSG